MRKRPHHREGDVASQATRGYLISKAHIGDAGDQPRTRLRLYRDNIVDAQRRQCYHLKRAEGSQDVTKLGLVSRRAQFQSCQPVGHLGRQVAAVAPA